MPIERAAPGAALLPGGGHVLDSNEVCRRLRLASDREDFAPARPQRRSWPGRVRALIRGEAIPGTGD